VFALLPMLNP